MSILTAQYLGQFIGMVELVERGYVNPTHFISRCIEIKEEYEKAKEEQGQ